MSLRGMWARDVVNHKLLNGPGMSTPSRKSLWERLHSHGTEASNSKVTTIALPNRAVSPPPFHLGKVCQLLLLHAYIHTYKHMYVDKHS